MTRRSATSAATIAARLIDTYDRRAFIERFATSDPEFDVLAAYEVLQHIESERRARGWQPVGRKIGFTNRTIWSVFGVSEPMWARMWDRTVSFAVNDKASLPLEQFVQPRIEQEVVFKLSASPAPGSSPAEVLSCVEWFAAAFEIVQCHFPDWAFNGAECTAAFGLHGALVVGTPTPVADRNLEALADTLATFKATLSRDGSVVAEGNGADVLGSPALALDHLVGVLAGQARFAPLEPGELVTTGTLINPPPVEQGDRWTSDYGALDVAGLTVTFT